MNDTNSTWALAASGGKLLLLTFCGLMAACDGTRQTVTVSSPSLTPAFNIKIHDYTVSCAATPEVEFTADMSIADNFTFTGPGASPQPVTQTTSHFQKTIALKPGQRFQFAVATLQNNYSVRCLPSDFPPLSATAGTGTSQAEYYLFSPDLLLTGGTTPYVIMTDTRGTPIWWMEESTGTAIDAKILGPDEITWTISSTYGYLGHYNIRNFSGEILNTISGNLDDHELQLTPSGTYLAIHDVQRVCPPDCADLSPWGGEAQAAPIDAEILELDGDSNVLWTWKTRDHIALAESAAWIPTVGNDIIHMNAVEPDGDGAVLFSARHLNAIYHITKSTGDIDWKVGGTSRAESLTVLNDTRPTAVGATGKPLSGQHDVRKWPDGTVSVHDNGTNANRAPYVVRYEIDTSARTADVVEEFDDSRVGSSVCCGSARRLPNGHWLINWGSRPLFTEMDSNHVPVFTMDFNLGGVFSYRSIPVETGVLSASTVRTGMDVIAGN